MSRLVVDLAQLAELVEWMERYLGHLAGLREEAVRAERLHPTWTGEAAVAQARARTRWAAGAAEVQDALASLRAVAAVARGNYEAAVLANRRMWAL
ncbi:MAG: WXG100 family type VII secretion target [Jatrophihabitans sp.]|uniref:WXG100 family type VII secretion target n=1 Tax=Jatrophihabitans sp. TaxID=1932789 RepID=UPI00391015C4